MSVGIDNTDFFTGGALPTASGRDGSFPGAEPQLDQGFQELLVQRMNRPTQTESPGKATEGGQSEKSEPTGHKIDQAGGEAPDSQSFRREEAPNNDRPSLEPGKASNQDLIQQGKSSRAKVIHARGQQALEQKESGQGKRCEKEQGEVTEAGQTLVQDSHLLNESLFNSQHQAINLLEVAAFEPVIQQSLEEVRVTNGEAEKTHIEWEGRIVRPWNAVPDSAKSRNNKGLVESQPSSSEDTTLPAEKEKLAEELTHIRDKRPEPSWRYLNRVKPDTREDLRSSNELPASLEKVDKLGGVESVPPAERAKEFLLEANTGTEDKANPVITSRDGSKPVAKPESLAGTVLGLEATSPSPAGRPQILPEMQGAQSTVHEALVHRVAHAIRLARQRDGEVRLRLHPPELGHLRIELRVEQGAVTARLEAESLAARDLLLETLPDLRQRLLEQRLKIDRLDVGLLGQFHSEGFGQHHAGPSPSRFTGWGGPRQQGDGEHPQDTVSVRRVQLSSGLFDVIV